MIIISRKTAKASGQKYYFTGKPCKRGGHIEKRWVCSFMCVECGREKSRDAYRALDTEQRRAIRLTQKDNFARWIAANREHFLESQKSRNVKHKHDNPDYFKQLYAQNRERRQQESRDWYQANTQRALENRKVYVSANRDKARVWGRKSALTRRAITKQVFVEVIDPTVVFERDKGMCGICTLAVDPVSPWEIDHVIPISKCGPHSYANVQLSHRTCNRSKSARLT